MNETYQDPPGGGGDGDPTGNDRLIGYLYDELSAEDRAVFEAELAADPTLAAEVSSLRDTRSHFAGIAATPMPRGLLDDVLKVADERAEAFAAEHQAPGLWQRLSEGLKRLVFQPSFAMGLVLFLVAGVALVATRNPSEIAGLEIPRDTQRIPPMAMAPAASKSAPASPIAAGSPAAVAADAPVDSLEGALAQPSVATREAGEAAPANQYEGDAKYERPAPAAARYVEARAKGDLDDIQAKSLEDKAAALDLRNDLGPTKDPQPAKDSASKKVDLAMAEPRAAMPISNQGNDGEGLGKTRAGEVVSGAAGGAGNKFADTGGPSATVPDVEVDLAKAAPKAEEKRKEQADEEQEAYAARERSAASRPSTTAAEVAKAPTRKGIDDSASETPSAPAIPANKPTEAPQSLDRVYTTLSQQLAAGAIADAERTLAELSRREGESTRVKKAREALAQAKARSQARPADTKPLPEPAKTPPR